MYALGKERFGVTCDMGQVPQGIEEDFILVPRDALPTEDDLREGVAELRDRFDTFFPDGGRLVTKVRIVPGNGVLLFLRWAAAGHEIPMAPFPGPSDV